MEENLEINMVKACNHNFVILVEPDEDIKKNSLVTKFKNFGFKFMIKKIEKINFIKRMHLESIKADFEILVQDYVEKLQKKHKEDKFVEKQKSLRRKIKILRLLGKKSKIL